MTDKVFFKIAIGGQQIDKEIEIGLFGGTVPKTVANFKVNNMEPPEDISFRLIFLLPRSGSAYQLFHLN